VLGSGRAVLSSGTAEVLSVAFKEPVNTNVLFESYYPLYCHVVNGVKFSFALNHSGGISFRWYRDTLGVPESDAANKLGEDPYAHIIACMCQEPSPVLFMPHFSGSPTPDCDLDSRACIAGMSFDTNRHHIAKALLEGLTFEICRNVQQLEIAGLEFKEIVAVGGGAKSSAWLQLRADILGVPIKTVNMTEAACLGAALLAFTAMGQFNSLEEAVSQCVTFQHEFIPVNEKFQFYSGRFDQYRQLYMCLKSLR
jgi:xylulokinase